MFKMVSLRKLRKQHIEMDTIVKENEIKWLETLINHKRLDMEKIKQEISMYRKGEFTTKLIEDINDIKDHIKELTHPPKLDPMPLLAALSLLSTNKTDESENILNKLCKIFIKNDDEDETLNEVRYNALNEMREMLASMMIKEVRKEEKNEEQEQEGKTDTP